MAIDTCVENFSGTVLKALAASTTKSCPLDDPRYPIPASIQDVISLKNRLQRQWQITRESQGQPPAEVGDPPAQRLEKRAVERNTWIPRPRRPIAVEDDQMGDESSYSISPLVTPGESFSQTLKKPQPLSTVWRLSFSWRPILRSWKLLRLLTWHWGSTPWPLPVNQS